MTGRVVARLMKKKRPSHGNDQGGEILYSMK